MNRTALIVTDAFPPDKSGRAEKMWRRVYYLTQNGWDINLLAPLSAAAPEPHVTQSVNGRTVHIVRTGYLFRSRWPSLKHNQERPIEPAIQSPFARLLDLVFVPKGYVRWLPHAIAAGRGLARTSDVILSINNPAGLHLVALALKLQSGRPWIAEFRDALVGYQYSYRGPEQINRQVERLIVANADRVLQWDDAIAAPIAARYPHAPQDKFVHLFPIGYDPAKFQDYPDGYHPDLASPLQIAYTGSFYGDTIVPTYFLQGLAQAVRAHNLTPSDIQVRFAGSWSSRYDDLLSELALTDYVSYCGWLSHEECVDLWQASDVLLLLLGEDEANQGLIPTKLWDYVAAQRYVLCLAPTDCRTATYLQRDQIGVAVSPQDEAAIAQTIATLIAARQEHHFGFTPNPEQIARASCVTMEQRIADIFDALSDHD